MMEAVVCWNPQVMMDKPAIACRRITVELSLEKLASAESIEQILKSYAHVGKAAVLAAIDFARKLASD